jgi:hypothetical protein
MKNKITLALVIFISYSSLSQIKVQSSSTTYFDDSGIKKNYDSTAYSYNSDGEASVELYKPGFNWPKQSSFPTWNLVDINPKYARADGFYQFEDNALEEEDQQTNTFDLNGNLSTSTDVEVNYTDTTKIIYTYNGNGNLISVLHKYYDVDTWVDEYLEEFQYSMDNKLTFMKSTILEPTKVQSIDSIFYQSGQIIKKKSYLNFSGTLKLVAESHVFYTGSKIDSIEVYDEMSGSFTKVFKIDYFYSGDDVNKIDVFSCINGEVQNATKSTTLYTFNGANLILVEKASGQIQESISYAYYNSDLVNQVSYQEPGKPIKQLDRVNYVQIASLDEVNKEVRFDVFPNPSTDIIQIHCNKTIKVSMIRDLSGKIVVLDKSGSKMIDVNDLNKGIYLLSIDTDNGSFTKKIAIQ